jgi:cell wall-associated NlpC family hydrolase
VRRSDANEINYFGDQLVYNAADNLGSPYRGGGTSKAGFDLVYLYDICTF